MTYDSIGRLQNITKSPAADTARIYAYTHNNLNQRTRVTREDGSYWSYIYNDRGELVSGKKYWSDNSIVWGTQREYNFDNLGNRMNSRSGGNQFGNLRQSNYTTNSLNQYSQRSVPGAVDITGTGNSAATVTVNNETTARKDEYFYKELAVDNSTASAYPQINIIGARNNFGAGGEDAVTQQGGRVFLPSAAEVFNYDFDGNLTSDGRWVYTWNGENRLVSMEASGGVPAEAKLKLVFAYDYMGRRIQKELYTWDISSSSYQLQSAKKFVYDGWSLVAEINGSGSLERNYAWSSELLFIGQNGNVYQAGHDANTNVTTLVQANTGKEVASYDYDPFGMVLKAIGEFASQNPFKYSSQYMDSETGLLYYGLRFYNPQIGRWINRDPSEEAGGLNLYAFASNDGIGRIDLLGLSDYSSIAKGDLIYSCNCGWIDWRHADPVPQDPFSTGQLWKNIYNESGHRSSYGLGFYVQYGQSYQVPKIPRSITPLLYYSDSYYVAYRLSWNDKVLVALSILKEVSEGFEHFQRLGGGNSSFSEEDLVSNLLALNRAIFNYDQGAIERICYALDVPKSQHIYRENYGGEGGSMGRSRSWLPNYYDVKDCQYCDKAPKAWPYNSLYQMHTIPKGQKWGDWISVE